MIKSITRRFLGMLLAVLMVLTMAPSIGLTAPVYAADGTAVTGLSDEGIGLSYSGDGTWKASGTTIEGSATGTSGCGGGSSTTTTLTITNNKTNEAVLSFAYSASLNSGSINVKGTEIKDESGTFPATPLKAGESITISVKSASDAKTTSIKLTNVSLSVAVKTADGKVFVEAIDCRPARDGNSWIIDFLRNAKAVQVAVESAVGRASIVGATFKREGVHVLIRCTDVGDVARLRISRATGLIGNIDIPAASFPVEVFIDDYPAFILVLSL